MDFFAENLGEREGAASSPRDGAIEAPAVVGEGAGGLRCKKGNF